MDAPDRALGAPGPHGARRPSGRLLLLYGRLIGPLLAGYLMFDKAFAYLHVPGTPLYVGELVIVVGVLGVLSATGYLRVAIRDEPILALLAAFFVWGLIRFLPGYRAYGINAIRDFALCYYCLFAFLIAAALARSPGIAERLMPQLARFVPWLLAWLPVGLLVQPLSATHGPNVPFTVYSVWTHEPGNAAFAALIALGSLWVFRGGRSARSRAAWSLMAFLVLALSATQNRGGLISIAAGALVGLAFLPDRRRLIGRAAAVTVLALGLAILLPFKFGGVGFHGREFSASQLLANVASIGGKQEAGDLEGTVAGRQVLWSLIYHHQIAEGQLFQGAGFGPNLAAEVGIHEGTAAFPLRNPHNSHLDVLARMGLMGFALWVALWLGWYRRLVVGCRRLEQRRLYARRSVAILCLMVATAILVSSFFSPQLEGAQVAAVLWTAFGIGVAVTSFRGWFGDRDLSLRRSEPPAALPRRAHEARPVTGTPRRSRWTAVLSVLVVVSALALPGCRSGGPGPAGQGKRTTAPGLTGAVGPIARSCRGVAVTAASDVQHVIDSHPPGTTFCLSAGMYRLRTPVVPKRGDALIGQLGAVLNGSEVLTSWRRSGNVWRTAGFLPPAPNTHGECVVTAPLCTYTQDVFFGKRRLRRVDSVAAVTAGTVFTDYRTGTITIGNDPRSDLVEQAVAPSLIQATADHVTVANLVIEEAANEAQVGAIESRHVFGVGPNGSGWRILHNDVRLNHGAGIGFAGASVVAGNFIHDQGQLGFAAYGTGSVVTNNEISFNGAAGYSAKWEAGGSKSWQTDHERVTHNYVHDNRGPGLWDDGGNINTTYEYNLIVNNWGAGIQHEISYDATIADNQISGNGFGLHNGWAWDAGILIQSSGGTKLINIFNNAVVDNYNGITLVDSGGRASSRPAPYGPHILQNVWVHGNTITSFAGQTGAFEDQKDPAVFTANHNRFDANLYYVRSLTGSRFSWANADISWERWRGYGNDPHGRVRLATTHDLKQIIADAATAYHW